MKRRYYKFHDEDKNKKQKYYRRISRKFHQTKQTDSTDNNFDRKAKAEMDTTIQSRINRTSNMKRKVINSPISQASRFAHKQIEESEQDNAGVEAFHESEKAIETGLKTVHHFSYRNKLKQNEKIEKIQKKADKTNSRNTEFKDMKSNTISNPFSKWQQRRQIKKEYVKAKQGKNKTANSMYSVSQSFKEKTLKISKQTLQFVTKHSHSIWLGVISVMMILILSGTLSSCSLMFQGSSNLVMASSYTATDENIIDVNEDYKNMEKNLQSNISHIEQEYPGYDEYRYDIDEINHNPYELTSYLTVLFEDYAREEVQDTLHELFNKQYKFSVGESKDKSDKDKKEIKILNVKLKNNGLRYAIHNSGLSDTQLERYQLLLETKGNRSYLFEDDIYANSSGEYTDYDIPGEALTDEKFANMIHEAEKYLGYPYVWGGSTPETSFDCSGFVSWVINNSNNGWNVGRQTANGLMDYCDIIPPSEAKPGDLIFFQGTYETPGASHVGIYAGNGMMIHCGNPISYENINVSYWQEHFYCYGRL